jgi:hypothetical protein
LRKEVVEEKKVKQLLTGGSKGICQAKIWQNSLLAIFGAFDRNKELIN